VKKKEAEYWWDINVKIESLSKAEVVKSTSHNILVNHYKNNDKFCHTVKLDH